jgi:hypothetical protein
VPRLCSVLSAAVAGAVFCVAALAPARAQSAPPDQASDQTDPFRLPDAASVFAPLKYDPRNPGRFRRGAPPGQSGAPSHFGELQGYGNPPASGAGATGFDSTNAVLRKARAAPRRKPGVSLPVAPPPGVVPDPVPTMVATRPSPQEGRRGASLGPTAAPTLVPAIATPTRRKPTVDLDPFAPVGVRTGAFVLFPAIELTGGYDTNPQRIAGEKGSGFVVVAPELRLRSDWERHALNADIKASYTDYFQSWPAPIGVSGPPVSLDRPNVDARADGRLDISSRNRLDVEGRLLVGTDNPGSPNLQAGLKRLPIMTTLGSTLAYTQSFNRFELTAKGSVDRSVWQASSLTDGTTSSNDDRDFDQFGGALRGSYELKPGIRPFAEIGTDTRVHDLALDRNGEDRDSNGSYAKAGSTFEITRKLAGEVSIGYLARRYRDAALSNIGGMTFDASLIYAATALTTFTLIAKSGVNEVTVPGVSGDLSRDIALQVDHGFRRWLTGTAKFGFGTDDYVGLARADQRWFASLGIIYKLNRDLQLKGEIRRDWLVSNDPGAGYTADQVLLGVRLQR